MLKGVRDTIIVKIEYEEQSKGGIVIPDTAKQYHGLFQCEVVSIGPEYPYKDDVKVGDKILIRRHEGHKIRYKNENYFSMREKWCVAKLLRKEVA